jgi:anion-transporting  ArsA/GET3 family ATPase
VLNRRLLIVTGKGGVGRSALTAALAIRAARAGRQVLAIGMTDETGLAAHFGVRTLGYSPEEVRPGIAAMAVDRATAGASACSSTRCPEYARWSPSAR